MGYPRRVDLLIMKGRPMSLKPQPIGPIPELTARVAHTAFPNGNTYLTLRDQLGTFYEDERVAGLFPTRGRPPRRPGSWRSSRSCSSLKGSPSYSPVTFTSAPN